MSEHDEQPIQVTRDAGVLTLRLNRPKKRNAITLAMYEALAQALEAAAGDSSVRVAFVTATGETFSSGNDLADFMASKSLEEQGEDAPMLRFLRALSTFPKPLVAAVDGQAIGIGFTMLLHCDLLFATERAQFRAPFVDLGLVPEAASSLLLPRALGHWRTSELMLLGDALEAPKAQAWGLVKELVPPAELQSRALDACRRLAAKPPTALRRTKALLKESASATVAERIRLEASQFAEQLRSPEVAEAISAFFEKRAPDFSKME